MGSGNYKYKCNSIPSVNYEYILWISQEILYKIRRKVQMKNINALQSQNNSLKKHLSHQLAHLDTLRQSLSVSQTPIFDLNPSITHALTTLPTHLQKLDSQLLQYQLQNNNSVEFRNVLKMLECKIRELRIQLHVKELGFGEVKEGMEWGLLGDGYEGPKCNAVRRRNIEEMHRHKIQKLVTNIAELAQQLKSTSITNPIAKIPYTNDNSLTNTMTNPIKSRSNSHDTRISTSRYNHTNSQQNLYFLQQMQREIKKQDARMEELMERYRVYWGLWGVLLGENRRLVGEIRAKVKSKEKVK